MELYELGGVDGRRYSLFSWRIRMALAHKGITPTYKPVFMSDKEAIAFSGGTTVPVLGDGETVVRDSWAIACYLEERIPEAPPLMGGEIGHHTTKLINNWADRELIPKLTPFIMGDLADTVAHPDERDWVRGHMEEIFKKPLDALREGREERIKGFQRALQPMRMIVRDHPFICGAMPAYADYIVFSLVQWARISSGFPVLAEDDPVLAWRERLLDAYDGLARREPAWGEGA